MGPQTKSRNAVELLEIVAELASQSPHTPTAINQPHAAARAPPIKRKADIAIGATFHNSTSKTNGEPLSEEANKTSNCGKTATQFTMAKRKTGVISGLLLRSKLWVARGVHHPIGGAGL
jgi:hypothetical protein